MSCIGSHQMICGVMGAISNAIGVARDVATDLHGPANRAPGLTVHFSFISSSNEFGQSASLIQHRPTASRGNRDAPLDSG
ncbi:hypothetical protein BURKHO8Y_30107 [Burkholderia sp. 8Y]|nr:hypothetical protein BURKHO8Y_30107 [Burkholderia sp. 8Y]